VRNDVDLWTRTPVDGTETTVNPQVSLAIGAESHLAYTEHISGTLPPTS
jgi:hypothetical protein